ncbi:MAG: coenzyme F420-0:L-glutamate ligase [Anaerolineae bacterium]|jgi:coenzyme F420-0:L-glutamate ligase|nr:coenzyme F420-0:L-glutamate ligase [Anaerolineae bacterium]
MSALTILPVRAPVQESRFDLLPTLLAALAAAGAALQDGDVLAVSSKYLAISEGRVVTLAEVVPGERARALAAQYHMDPAIAELVVQEAEHIFGGIPLGFLLTWRSGIMAPNAGIDRSNIPGGKAVLLPADPYGSARALRQALRAQAGVNVGTLLTDSWLVPGRRGTTGVALATAGFLPIQDERGKLDLFGNPMKVTQRSLADTLSVCAQMVMGERDEATPFAILRHTGVTMTDAEITQEMVAIPWELCLYVESLTVGLLPDGAPRESYSAKLAHAPEAGG